MSALRPPRAGIITEMDGVSDRPWRGVTRSSYPTAAVYCAACVIDENPPGAAKVKARCKLPVVEPPSRGGELNRRAVHAATDRLLQRRRGVAASPAVKAAAAQRLLELYRQIGEQPPAALRSLAGAVSRVRGVGF